MSSESSEPNTLKSRWMRYWLDPQDKSYMKELPLDDYEMNTVTTVNPYIYLDEIEQAKKQKEYRERVEIAQRRREMQAKAIKKQEKVFIKQVNTKGGPGWFQDLSVRQMELTEDLRNILIRDQECKMIEQTQDYLRDLGITPYIKGNAVFKVLKESDGDPVKFLILIQKVVAKREQEEYKKDYEQFKLAQLPVSNFSVNERLLLSAAFHIHFPVFTKKLARILPPPPEPPRVKWAEKKKKRKPKWSSPYLEKMPINDMCWYEEKAYHDLKQKVLKQIAKQNARDRYLESLKPKKAAELEEEVGEKDRDSENWDDWLDEDEEQPQEKPLAKKLKKRTSMEELDAQLKEDENFLISNPLSDTNLYESSKQQQEEVKKDKMGPHIPEILKYYDGYKDMTKHCTQKSAEDEVVEEDPQGISAPEAHFSAVIKGKLIQKSSTGTQTAYDPALGTLTEYLRAEHDLRAAIVLSNLTERDTEQSKKRVFQTNGYNDYTEDLPSDTLVNLMNEIREDLSLLKGVEKYAVYRTKSVESILTLPSDTSYLSVESYLYDSDYREGRSEEAKKLKNERKKKRMERVFTSKKTASFNVECWGDTCGLISSDEEIPMDEFKLAKKIISELPAEDALKYAIKYLKDRGDPMAVLPGVHRVPKLAVWYDNRYTIKTEKQKELEKVELLDKSYSIWGSPAYKVSSMLTPELSIPRCVTWDWIDKVKKEADEVRSKHFRMVKQQLVTTARNYFPSMMIDNYNTKLMKDFRKTFFAYLPSKELDTVTFNPGKRTQEEEDEIVQCYKGRLPVYKSPSEVPKNKQKKQKKRKSTKKMKMLSFAGEDKFSM